MDVEVDIQDPQPVSPRAGDRERRIVVDAEARRARSGIAWWRPPPGWKACSTSPRRIASIARSDPPATAAAGLMHAGERRVVAAFADPGLRRPVRIDREPPHDLDVAPRVAQQQVRIRTPARARAPAPHRPTAAGRCPARTAAGSADDLARSRSRSSAVRRRAACPARYRGRYHPRMQDIGLVLIVVLVLVLLWRGPKTLPKLGQALGRGVREAREEAPRHRSGARGSTRLGRRQEAVRRGRAPRTSSEALTRRPRPPRARTGPART